MLNLVHRRGIEFHQRKWPDSEETSGWMQAEDMDSLLLNMVSLKCVAFPCPESLPVDQAKLSKDK